MQRERFLSRKKKKKKKKEKEKEKEKEKKPVTPLFWFAPLREWGALLREQGVDRAYLGRAAATVCVSALTAPLRLYESARYGATLRRTTIDKAPIFIVGYGRSGTTHLHNLLAQDPRFGYVTNFQALAQGFALSGESWLEPLVARLAPKTRPMDNVAIHMNGPQEEEVALACISRHSFLHNLAFPTAFDPLFHRYVLLEGLDPKTLRDWENAYLSVLKKATLACGHKRLVLKSPTNTGRVRALLKLFPKARFIHIYRDPYVVFDSISNLYRKLLPGQQLQHTTWRSTEDNFVRFYRDMLLKFFDDRNEIPAKQYAEVRFEDLEAHPLRELGRLYDELEIDEFATARLNMQAYLDNLGPYTKNVYQPSVRTIERVNRDWAFSLEAWAYPRRSAP